MVFFSESRGGERACGGIMRAGLTFVGSRRIDRSMVPTRGLPRIGRSWFRERKVACVRAREIRNRYSGEVGRIFRMRLFTIGTMAHMKYGWHKFNRQCLPMSSSKLSFTVRCTTTTQLSANARADNPRAYTRKYRSAGLQWGSRARALL